MQLAGHLHDDVEALSLYGTSQKMSVPAQCFGDRCSLASVAIKEIRLRLDADGFSRAEVTNKEHGGRQRGRKWVSQSHSLDPGP